MSLIHFPLHISKVLLCFRMVMEENKANIMEGNQPDLLRSLN